MYQVTSRSGRITGSDGVPIEHVVRFANVDDVSVGFSAAVDGSMPSPDPRGPTGGVRMKRADGNAMWTFATVGAKVVVVRVARVRLGSGGPWDPRPRCAVRPAACPSRGGVETAVAAAQEASRSLMDTAETGVRLRRLRLHFTLGCRHGCLLGLGGRRG